MKRVSVVALALVLLIAAIATRSALRPRPRPRPVPAPDVNAPANTRVRVQVLNATNTRGLARRATMHLRDRGFDVLEVGTWNEQLDSTLVLDRSGHPDWAKRVADALGGARVESRPDSSRYLDVTVLLGRSWRPPAQPFYP
ncbi:MAG TPA: LytR C-terminal domain-containing protein [Gemmatimonadaceae bacterium]|nr:LytR C-terminal domain-containing protein [Gemmatimonadaceae bacterium]